MNEITVTRATPAGPMRFAFRSAASPPRSGWVLVRVDFGAGPPVPASRGALPRGLEAELRKLDRYAAGDVTALDAIPCEPEGTPFQKRVWEELRRIPAGATISYGELARRVGDPKAVRAVAAANGRNPIPLVIPCHRVIAADGSLHGYGGGLERKRVLLEHEGAPFRRERAPVARNLTLFEPGAGE